MIISSPLKVVVAVTQRIDPVPGRSEVRDALDQRLTEWLIHAGFLPVLVPNTLQCVNQSVGEALASWLRAVKPGALLLSGGNDIGEYVARDILECSLLKWAKAKRIPVLGICRGLQMIAKWSGAELIKRDGHVGKRHQLVVSTDTAAWPATVNSFHNWCLVSCPEGFTVAAHAGDNSIEAIKHIDLPWEGWMWHPEREDPFNQIDIERLRRLFIG